MSRGNIFGDGKLFKEEQKQDLEYKPPEEELVDSGLVHRLIRHYINQRDDESNRKYSLRWSFRFEAQELTSIFGEPGDTLRPQLLIDSLTALLKDELDGEDFTRTYYLTALVQALYNLNQGNEFIVNIRDWPGDWPESGNYVGNYLKGKPRNPLTLHLYGNASWCCDFAEDCNFIIHDRVWECGQGAEYSDFTFHDNVWICGSLAKGCTFSLMPNVKIGVYSADHFRGNVLRKMNENGDWEKVLPEQGRA